MLLNTDDDLQKAVTERETLRKSASCFNFARLQTSCDIAKKILDKGIQARVGKRDYIISIHPIGYKLTACARFLFFSAEYGET